MYNIYMWFESSIVWLVVWNMPFMTFHSVGNVIIPSDFHKPPTR